MERANPVGDFGLILSQDLANMGEVQAGQHSLGFTGARTNPKQETTVAHFHQFVRSYLGEEA